MPRPALRVTPAELKVLESLWDRGPASIRTLRDAIYPGGGSTKFATVQKLLDRLAAKKLVARRQADEGQVFAARVDRQALIGDELNELAARLGSGSVGPLAMTLVTGGMLTDAERAELIELLKSAPVRPSGGKPSGERATRAQSKPPRKGSGR